MANKLEYESDRRGAAPYCPCGKSNSDGKFSPLKGYTDKGKCWGCGKFFPPDGATAKDKLKSKVANKAAAAKPAAAPISYIPLSVLKQSLGMYNKNTLVKFIEELTDLETTQRIISEYKVGTSMYWKDSTVFWQIDFHGKVRAGRIVQYQVKQDEKCFIGKNCNRVQTNELPVKWVHKLLKVHGYNLSQCFFGEHLLKKYPDKTVGVLESEKSCLIASAYFPEMLWLGSGGVDGLRKKMDALEGRKVVLYPDLKQFEQWDGVANEMRLKLKEIKVVTSDALERKATPEERAKGLDLADFLIRERWSPRPT